VRVPLERLAQRIVYPMPSALGQVGLPEIDQSLNRTARTTLEPWLAVETRTK